MKKYLKYILFSGAAMCGTVSPYTAPAVAQQIVIEPLFEYPTAPENIENLQERSDWLMSHFWDKFDFKSKSAVDQNALNDAFGVYASAMQFASQSAVDKSVDALLKNIKKNPVLLMQMTKAAEESLYGPRAYLWSDDIFLKFLDALTASKQVKKERKLRAERISTQLRNTAKGAVPPAFDYKDRDGRTARYVPNGVITVIEFGDPGCNDCALAKIKLSTNVKFSSLVDKGKINVLFINPEPEEGWEAQVSGYPANWHVGASEDVADIYDLRTTPAIYVIDRLGHVAAKNIGVETAMEIATAAASQISE
ncbi:MAG: DUF5106 domain-containing protein [Muribaculaceae bacterium]|nr:DUF5106 domain-containing protein [Muribaculaceae bacterium]